MFKTHTAREPFGSRKGASTLSGITFGVILFSLIAAGFWYLAIRRGLPKIDTEYQAVLLDNGSVYFGKLEGNVDFPVLTDVYAVQSTVNPDTKQVTNSIVRRSREWHSPERMSINAQHIVFIEPVAPGSQVARLIADSKASGK